MFTGIVMAVGRVKAVEKQGASGRITVDASLDPSSVQLGGSIAVSGVCLTITRLDKDSFTADMSAETIRLTTLGGLKKGDVVNMELPLTPSAPLGGHMVTGHVDCVGTLRSRVERSGYVDLEVSLPEAFSRYVVKKGSIAVDGVSLTVTEASAGSFRVSLIPHSLERTNLSSKKEGSSVNIETDIIAKYVERLARPEAPSTAVTEATLIRHGFMKRR